ncbi:L-ascorbate metabolism protein UlaG (beta-lactamase superfamily) [Kibdelosporangium banguiense]|uniref:L-ascorbate metabolism protein UlaG (Beta-lactamase superfamily) n=1 Tax=Kibdelosporangium banguiense TaxID=1365924 RepID=A0ABS4TP91_9PSEU|nr:MBL fold metallo-hydrolase [Kibdelosporangium banguiense]MBP2326224.1 L-ascorbate metabolism protein UlaG (beta-lactamase superfamily) [Kibdelosporangium banguiense]
MRITKYTHACVRLEREDGGVLVIDPGEWSEPAALAGADAVLVTHEHGDHIDVLRLIGLGVEVYVPEGVTFDGLETTQIAAGSSAEIAGFSVSVVCGRHAYVHDEQPSCVNFGYIVDDSLYHPGDALTVPDRPIETLLVPMYASWLKTAEALDFIRAVAPQRAFGVHDAQLNDRGLASINSWFSYASGTDYQWLAPGTSS